MLYSDKFILLIQINPLIKLSCLFKINQRINSLMTFKKQKRISVCLLCIPKPVQTSLVKQSMAFCMRESAPLSRARPCFGPGPGLPCTKMGRGRRWPSIVIERCPSIPTEQNRHGAWSRNPSARIPFFSFSLFASHMRHNATELHDKIQQREPADRRAT
jgi:hypothetical protein